MTVYRDTQIQIADGGSYAGGTTRKNVKITTTDNTATVILSIPVAEGEVYSVMGQIVGKLGSATGASCTFVSGAARRQASGNVALIGTPTATVQEDASNAPGASWNANTSAQTLELKVTGNNSETWTWEGAVFITKL